MIVLYEVSQNSLFWAHSIHIKLLDFPSLREWRSWISLKIPPEDLVHGNSLYVGIWFSEASWEIAPESTLLYYTTSFIHSTADILAPNEQSANRRSPPPSFGDPCFSPDTCSSVDIFHDRIFAATTDCGQARWSTLLLLTLMETSFIFYYSTRSLLLI